MEKIMILCENKYTKKKIDAKRQKTFDILCENKYTEKKIGAKRRKFWGILCENNYPQHISDSHFFVKISSPKIGQENGP